MNTDKNISKSRGSEKVTKLPRPILITSKETFNDYHIFLEHLLAGLADESINAAMICEPKNKTDSIGGAAEIIRHPIVNLPFMTFQNNKRLLDSISKFRPTVLHCLCQNKAAFTRQLSRKLNLPYILMVNSLQKKHKRLSISGRRCTTIIVPTQSISNNLSQMHPRFASRIKCINYGTFAGDDIVCFKDSNQITSIITEHPLSRVNDFDCLFGAIRHLAIDGYEFLLILLGTGSDESKIRKLICSHGLSQNITIVPRLQPWRSIFSATDIFIQPQPKLSFNPFLLEAMAAGTVVAGCKGGVDDLIIEGETAAVFDSNDELSIYNTLQKLLGTREWARKIACNSQKLIRENYNVSSMVSSIIKVYRDIKK